MQRAYGFSEQGATTVWTNAYASENPMQGSWPYATVTVYITGTTTLATLYSDDNVPPTPMANPFTADENGWWWFYAPNGRYDVALFDERQGGLAWTIGDVFLYDTGQDPNANLVAGPGIVISPTPGPPANSTISTDPVWPGDNNANGYQLLNASLVQTGCLELTNGACSMSLCLDANCNTVVTGQSGNTIATLSEQGNLAIAGCLTLLTATCQRSICVDANCNLGFSDPSGNETAWITPEGDFHGRDLYVRNISGGDFVSNTRQVIAGAGLTGGGPLSSDVTLALASDVSVNSITADTVYTCHIVCPGTLLLDAPAVNIPNILYVNGLVVDGIPVPPPPVASWNGYTPQLWDGSFAPITSDAVVVGRYSVWGSWMVLSFGVQFNPQGHNQAYFHIGLPPGLAVHTSGVGLVFTCYFNNAPGLTPTIADWQVTQVGNVIRVATLGSTTSAFMQMSLQGILEVEGA